MRYKKRCEIWLVTLVILLLASSAWSKEKPLWELGIGTAIGSFPSYRGASSSHTKILPFPLIIYRGERLSLDRKGLHGKLFESERWRLELSADAMVPVEQDTGLRSNMPELSPILELGPSLEYLFADDDEIEWRLRLPLRGAIAIDTPSLASSLQGFTFHPNLAVDAYKNDWKLGGSIGPLFASRDYHNYYYGVSNAYATPQRTEYEASGGFSGTRLMLGASRYFGNFWIGMFVRYDDLNRAVFMDSPLVEQTSSVMGGLAVSWIFKRSERMVERR